MDRRTVPLQEVHPVVAGTDIAAELAACALFWKHRPLAGLLARLVPPVIATALMPGTGAQPEPDEDEDDSPFGPPPAPRPRPPINLGIRAAGDALTLWGAWRRSPPMILAGAAVIAFGWSVNVAGPSAVGT